MDGISYRICMDKNFCPLKFQVYKYTYHVMFEFNFSRLQSFHHVPVVARCQSWLVIQNGHTSSNTVSSYKFFLGRKVQVLIQD